jgi:uncharacterized protein YecE (DUF72 family)
MEFGRVPVEELERIDFSLPSDPASNRELSRNGYQAENKFYFYYGSTKWSYPEWIGRWYPKGTKSGQFLERYAQLFNSIELNATYYRMPTYKQTHDWKNKVRESFRFCPKFVDQITHIRRLRETQSLVNEFLEGISGFGENLGPVLFMPHPAMGPKHLDTIIQFLDSIPREIPVAVELRHQDWFTEKTVFNQLCRELENQNRSTVITDTAGRRDCIHMQLTSRTVMIRFVGNDLHPTDYTRIDQWVARIKQWKDHGIQKIYFFVHQQDETLVPELSYYLVKQLNTRLGLSITSPEPFQTNLLFDKID